MNRNQQQKDNSHNYRQENNPVSNEQDRVNAPNKKTKILQMYVFGAAVLFVAVCVVLLTHSDSLMDVQAASDSLLSEQNTKPIEESENTNVGKYSDDIPLATDEPENVSENDLDVVSAENDLVSRDFSSEEGFSKALWYEIEYDQSSGLRNKVTQFDPDGSVDGWYQYEYDGSGRNSQINCYNADGTSNGWFEYTYDEAGNMVKEQQYYTNGSPSESWTEYEYALSYDDSSWLLVGKSLYEAGLLLETTDYDSNDYGIVVSVRIVGGVPVTFSDYFYDDDGRLVRLEDRTGDGIPESAYAWHEYIYSETGEKTKDIYYEKEKGSEPCQMTDYEYNAVGDEIRVTIYYRNDSE